MKTLNLERLQQSEKLYNYQLNEFDFYSGVNFEGEFYPIPIKERDLIKEKKLNFPYADYVAGFNKGYSLPLPANDDVIFTLLNNNYSGLKYFVADGLVTKGDAVNFGRTIGIIFKAWEEVIRRIDDFMPFLEPKTKQGTLTPLIKDNYTVRLKKIHSYLKAGEYIDCSENDFFYWFGQLEMEKTKKIHWLKADSMLKNVIHQMCGTSGEDYINIAFVFKNKYVSTNYKKDYVGSDMYHKIKEFMEIPLSKI